MIQVMYKNQIQSMQNVIISQTLPVHLKSLVKNVETAYVFINCEDNYHHTPRKQTRDF